MLSKWQERIPSRISSNLVLFLYFVDTIVAGYLVKAPENRILSVNWHLLDFVKALSIVLLALAFRKILVKNKLFLLIICIAGIFIQFFTAWMLSKNPLPNFMYQGLPLSPISDFAIIIAISLIIESFINTYNGNIELKKNRQLLKNIGASLDLQIKEEEKKLNLEVSKVVEEVVGGIENQLIEAKSGLEELNKVTSAMQNSINEVIRPLSHKMQFEDEILELRETANQKIKFNPISFIFHRVDLGKAFSPNFITLVLVGTILGTYLFLLDFAAFIFLGIPTMVANYFLLQFVHGLVSKKKAPVIIAFLFNVIVSILVAFFFSFTSSLFKDKYDSAALSVIVSGAFTTPFFIGIGTVFYAYALTVISEGAALNEESLKYVKSARSNLWAYQKMIGRLLHGGVQARFQAATIKLAKRGVVDEEIIQEVKKELSNALASIDNPLASSGKTLKESLAELKDMWSYGCNIKINLDEGIYSKFIGKPFATECVLEIINEAVTNAVKHGGADQVSISGSKLGENLVEFVIKNPILNPTKLNPKGLGSEIITEASASFDAKISDGVYILTASIFVE